MFILILQCMYVCMYGLKDHMLAYKHAYFYVSMKIEKFKYMN